MSLRKVVLVHDVGTDNCKAEFGVHAQNDYQAIQIVAEHYPMIKNSDFEVLTMDGFDVPKGYSPFEELFE